MDRDILLYQQALQNPDYNPDELVNIEKTLKKLLAHQSFYDR